MKIAYLLMFLLMAGSFQAAHGKRLRNAQRYTYRGLSRQRQRDLDGAIEDFTTAIELGRDNAGSCLRQPGERSDGTRTTGTAQLLIILKPRSE